MCAMDRVGRRDGGGGGGGGDGILKYGLEKDSETGIMQRHERSGATPGRVKADVDEGRGSDWWYG